MVAQERRVELAQGFPGLRLGAADDDPVRAPEVVHRRAFLEELRIARHRHRKRLRRRARPRRMISSTRSAVPTGTVDLLTTMQAWRSCAPSCSATASTWLRSAEPSSPHGVPTAMNTTSASARPSARLAVKVRRAASS